MKIGIKYLLIFLVLIFTISCTASPDYDKSYDHLRAGMSQSQAEKIMGTPAHKIESVTIAGATLERLTWCHRNEYYSANFILGHLVSTDKGKNTLTRF